MNMIANALIVLIGLYLSYQAIFAIPASKLGQIEMASAGVAVIVLALWARRTDLMGWHSGTNIALGLLVLALAVARHVTRVDPLELFWMILLIGIAMAITAMWSMLHRPGAAPLAESR
jgi:hypothetical protein